MGVATGRLQKVASHRTRLAVLLIAALAAVVLAAGAGAGTTSATAELNEHGDPSFVARSLSFDGALTRLTPEERRDGSQQRALKHRLVLLAVLTVLLGAAFVAHRGALVDRRAQRLPASWWSPQAGRSPPSLPSLLIV